MNNESILGIDLGGTNVRGGVVTNAALGQLKSKKINARGTIPEIMQELYCFIDNLVSPGIGRIGIGVPGLVDSSKGIVFDVTNIPSFKEVPLQKLLEERFNIPVIINNDANCFALGEYYFGKGKGCSSMVGLTIGTGLGAGLILNKKLYSGKNSGAGEFGSADYLEYCYEYYASGQYFSNVYKMSGEQVYEMALSGDARALKMYAELGKHLGNALKLILYALDVELIVLGGSVRHAMPFFSEAMFEQLDTFAFKKSVEQLRVEVSLLENAGVLGAAALCLEH